MLYQRGPAKGVWLVSSSQIKIKYNFILGLNNIYYNTYIVIIYYNTLYYIYYIL